MTDAKIGRGGHRVVPIEELVFTGYSGFADGGRKERRLMVAEEISLVVKFFTIDELDQTSSGSSR